MKGVNARHWFWSLLVVMLATLVLRIWCVHNLRAEVMDFYAMDKRQKALVVENTQLTLERSVLLRADRLVNYGSKNLNLRRARTFKKMR